MNETLLKELDEFLNSNNLEYTSNDLDEICNITWKSKIELKCKDCNTSFSISVKQLLRPHPERQGMVCPRCDAERLFINKINSVYGRLPYEFESTFLGYNEPLTVKCKDCGNIFTVNAARNLTFPNNNAFHPCKKCVSIRNYKNEILNIEKKLIELFGECKYEFLIPEVFDDTISKKKVKVKCKICNDEFYVNPQNLLTPRNGKHYCKNCDVLEKTNSTTKKSQVKKVFNISTSANTDIVEDPQSKKDLKEWFKTLYNGEVLFDSKEVSEEYPVDIYTPDKKIAIDLCILKNNNHYHVEKKFHIDRTNIYNKKGVRLIQIMEDEWESHPEIVKEKIKTIFGKNNKNLYARKCKVVDIDSGKKNIFMNKYHIQGEDRAAFAKALEYDGEIVAVMTFIKPRLALGSKVGSTVNTYELSRYASSRHVVGGFSKLLNVILNEHPDIEVVKTFADVRWSSLTDNVYAKNGFVEKHISEPNYWYFDTMKSGKELRRIHRFNFRKQELEKKFPGIYDKQLTEFQIMDKTSYARVFDCGNLVYEYKVKK